MKRAIYLTLILFALTSCVKEFKGHIYDEPGYAIGKVNSTISVTLGVQYNYSYAVGSTEYKGSKKATGINQGELSMIGRRFLVVYKLSEPAKSDINFRYPINTEQDFLDMLERFKDNPPKP